MQFKDSRSITGDTWVEKDSISAVGKLSPDQMRHRVSLISINDSFSVNCCHFQVHLQLLVVEKSQVACSFAGRLEEGPHTVQSSPGYKLPCK